MPKTRIQFRVFRLIVAGLALSYACGCGGGSMGVRTPRGEQVFFPNPLVTVPRNGSQVILSIFIMSSSETAVVTVSGLPAGVDVKYSSSDTNPSGSLAFTALATTAVGTYTPIVSVNSASQIVTATFTLIVTTG